MTPQLLDLLLGIDCSVWQDDNSTAQRMDFSQAKAAGARFAFIKASQAKRIDEDFIYNWDACHLAGLHRGAYHYLDWTCSGKDQAEFFCGLIENDPGEIWPVLDYENRYNVPPRATAVRQVEDFISVVESRLGTFPMIYTSPWYWGEYGSTDRKFERYPLWIANYEVSKPNIPAPWDDFEFWQFTSKGPGLTFGAESLSIDQNYYNGDWSDFVGEYGHVPEVDPPIDDRSYHVDYTEDATGLNLRIEFK